MAKKIYSPYQKDIIKAYNTTNNNLFITAGPGCGKSFILTELVNQKSISKKAIMLAFNKSIADELKPRVPSDVDTSTLHSLGMRLLRKHVNCNLKVNALKSWVMGKKLFGKFLDAKYKKNEKDKNIHLFTIARLIDLYRMNLKEPTAENFLLLSDSFNVGADLIEIQQAVELAGVLTALNENHNEVNELVIDFTDMIYLPVKWLKSEDYPKYDEVYIDEAQDVSGYQKVMIDNLIGRRGRFICVGDEKQAIYGFAGSNLDQLNKFKNSKNTTILPLSVSYRCAKKIVEEANKIFPEQLEAFEGNDEGIVRYGTLDEIRPNDFIICRNNMPLVDNYISMIGEGKRAYIMGKDFGKSLLSLLLKIYKIDDLDIILEEKKKQIGDKGHDSPSTSQAYQALLEKAIILRTLYSKFPTFDKMKEVIEGMFKDENEGVKDSIVLMTAHKSKGLEADRVIWINKELFPSKYAVTENEKYSEKCLQYVLTTRAKKELIIVNGVNPEQLDVVDNLKSL